MDNYIVKIRSTEYITADVKRIRVEKPKGYRYVPGQAADVSINKDGLRDEKRPFTFTSLNRWPLLEFIIKIYRDHNGVTSRLERLQEGDELIIGKAWGAITYKGPGVFIAGGAGITPFIAIMRQLASSNELKDDKLIYSNKTASDIILKGELEKMFKGNVHHVFTRDHVIGFTDKRIDEDYLKSVIKNFSQHFYICGPDPFVKSMQAILLTLGAAAEAVVIEK
jgi:ferredoxin-NADP reductase